MPNTTPPREHGPLAPFTTPHLGGVGGWLLVNRGGNARVLLALAPEIIGAVEASFGVTRELEPALFGTQLCEASRERDPAIER